jgi:hypothetical protein
MIKEKIKTLKKRAGNVAQMVKHLPSRCKALSSNLSTTKKKKNMKTGEITLCLAEGLKTWGVGRLV